MRKFTFLTFGLFIIFFVGAAKNANAATTWAVTKSSNSSDGSCDAADCSLREAVAAAQSGDTIVFNPSPFGYFALDGEELVVTKHITIDGQMQGNGVAHVAGGFDSRLFFVRSGASLTLKNMTLLNGNGVSTIYLSTTGGAIATESNSSLRLDRVAVRDNEANFAGAIYLHGDGTHSITNSSITGNRAAGGSAIVVSNTSHLYMANVTVSGNSTTADGDGWGALLSFSEQVVIRNSTFTNNRAKKGGGIYVGSGDPGDFDIGNSIVAGNTATVSGNDIDYGSSLISAGGNLIGNTDTIPAGIFTQPNDETGVNPLLAPLNVYEGHPVHTHLLQAGSPAINSGLPQNAINPLTNQPLSTDARGANFPRVVGGAPDKGAFEDQTNGNALIVTKKADGNDGVCDTDCSLREAVAAAQADPGTETIDFKLIGMGARILPLGGAEIVIENQNVNIVNGLTPDASGVVVTGENQTRIFRIRNASVKLTNITLADGNGASSELNNFGGAIYAYGGAANLTLDGVVVRDNRANFYGAMFLSGGRHRIINSTIDHNRANDCIGIGVAGGELRMANATVSTNLDINGGDGFGALCNLNSETTIRNSTIAFNRVANGAGAGIWSDGSLDLGNTIVSNNIGGSDPDIHVESGSIVSVGGNLVSNSNGFPQGTFNQTSDVVNVGAMLAALADNGGRVTTHLLQPGSPAINGGVNANAIDPANNSALMNDARGGGGVFYSRIQNVTVDKGAFETTLPTSATVSVSGRVTNGKRGAWRARVEMIDANGITRTATTNQHGYFRFENVESGATYIFSVAAKNLTFQPRVIIVAEQIDDLDFAAESIR